MNKYKRHFSWKVWLLALLGFLIVGAGVTVAILKGVTAWYETNRLVFKKPVEIAFNKPISIEERKVEVKEIVKVIETIPNPVDLQTDTEKYIYEVFGIEDYKVAIAVARAESGLREDAININTNNTVDLGIFQINSVHFKKEGCSLKEVATVKGNIDCAHKLFEEQGFSPWVVWNTGAFRSKYE